VFSSLAAAAFMWCSVVSAQSRYPECDQAPSESDVDAAKGMHKAAEQYYAKARYDRAIQSWMEAYGFDCRAHGLLINIGNAYEKLGETKKAIEAFETYLARTGDGADPTIRDKVANLKDLLSRQPPPAPPPPTPDPLPQPPPPPKPNGNHTGDEGPGPYPWLLVGIGGAVAIAGGVLLGLGIKNENEASDKCPDRVNCDPDTAQLGNDGRTMQIAGGVMLVVGAPGILSGILWYAIQSSAAESSGGLGPSVTLTPQFSGLSLSGTF
jgi:tetratricopeptide (TPR) repeat protein